MPPSRDKESSGTQSIQRAACLLRLLTANNRTGMRLVDVCREASLERATTHRILQGLIAEGLVTQDQQTKHYFLGPALYEMGLAAAPKPQLRDICHPHVENLARISGDTVFVTARAGLDGVCLDRAEGAFPVRAFVMEVGRHRPLGVGGGALALLAGLPPKECDDVLVANRARLQDRIPGYRESTARLVIARARRVGYVLSDVVEWQGIRTLAMAIHGPHNIVTGALSISAMSQRLEADRLAELVAAMRAAVNAIEEELAASPLTALE